MRRVWPDRVVEENNLHAQISALRKALGVDRDLIRTVAGRGYQFTGEIRAAAESPDRAALSSLPEPVSELIGRDEAGARGSGSRHEPPVGDADRRRRHREDSVGARGRASAPAALRRRRRAGGAGAADRSPTRSR